MQRHEKEEEKKRISRNRKSDEISNIFINSRNYKNQQEEKKSKRTFISMGVEKK